MDAWILKQLRAMVLTDLLDLIPKGYFDQEIETYDTSIKNSEYLSRELKWGIHAANLGRSLHFDSPLGIKPRQVSASELLMNLGMLAASESLREALKGFSDEAKARNLHDSNAGNVARQLSEKHIPTFHKNIRGALAQYLKYLSSAEQPPFLPLLETDTAKAPPISDKPVEGTPLTSRLADLPLGQNVIDIATHTFRVALSFPGDVREMVKEISDDLESRLGKGSVFYDNYYIPQLARPSLDTLLQDLYRKRASLIVVFISGNYQEKKWCGVEFRAIREIIFEREHERIMFVRTGDGSVDGVFNTDGYVDASRFTSTQISSFIVERLEVLERSAESLTPIVANGAGNRVPAGPSMALETSSLDVVGRWDIDKAKQIANDHLTKHNWAASAPELEKPLHHKFVGDYHLVYKAKEGIILAFGTITEGHDCHACAPYLSLFEFEKRDGRWKLVTFDIGICKAGRWGELPKLGVHAVADDRYGVFMQGGYMAHGWGIGTTSIHVRFGDEFREVLILITSQSAPDGRSWRSKLTIHPTAAGLYDIEVQRSGESGAEDMVFMDGNPDLKFDVADYDDRIRPHDVFKFDGQRYGRHEVLT